MQLLASSWGYLWSWDHQQQEKRPSHALIPISCSLLSPRHHPSSAPENSCVKPDPAPCQASPHDPKLRLGESQRDGDRQATGLVEAGGAQPLWQPQKRSQGWKLSSCHSQHYPSPLTQPSYLTFFFFFAALKRNTIKIQPAILAAAPGAQLTKHHI